MKVYSVTEFGAVADGETLATAAVQRAVDTCHLAGGCAAGQDVLAVLAVIRVPDSPGSDVLGELFILLGLNVRR